MRLYRIVVIYTEKISTIHKWQNVIHDDDIIVTFFGTAGSALLSGAKEAANAPAELAVLPAEVLELAAEADWLFELDNPGAVGANVVLVEDTGGNLVVSKELVNLISEYSSSGEPDFSAAISRSRLVIALCSERSAVPSRRTWS